MTCIECVIPIIIGALIIIYVLFWRLERKGRTMKGSNAGVLIAILIMVIILMALLMWGILVIDWSKVLT